MKILLLIVILIFLNKYSYSSSLFQTSFHEVEFKSNDIENDKFLKIKKIKIKSFKNILKKTLDSDKFDELNIYITEDLINSFIKNIVINDEKIINDEYYSNIKINFDKKKIINFFRQKKTPYTEYLPNKYLLIIYEENEIAENLFSNNNKFYLYFNNYLKENKLFKIPQLDINDRFLLNKDQIKNKDLEKIKNFSSKYKLDEVIIVLANTTNNLVTYNLILYSDERILEKKLEFNKKDLKLFFKILENEAINMWKKLNQIQNTSLNLINCKLNYFNIYELKEIRNNLGNVSVIENLNIKTLSYKNIEYDIYYYGNLKILTKILNLNKLKISNINNLCRISLK